MNPFKPVEPKKLLSQIRGGLLCRGAGILFGLLCADSLHALDITGTSNSEQITEITVIDNGATVVQMTPSGADDNDPTPALLEFVNITAGGGTVLDEFNTGVVTAVTLNFTSSTGFNAYVDNQTINSGDTVNFPDAVKDVYSDRDLRNYMDKSSSANSNNPNGDYDIFYQFSLSNDDYLVVAERDGNSELSVQALNAAGVVIPGSQTLVFKTGGNTFFEWDTGFRSQEDGNNNQTLEIGVVDISQFGTSDNIFGLRVINNSGADNKIFVASDDPFTDNPPNPTQLPIFTVIKSARVDNGTLTAGDDFYVPGAEIIYRVTVTNSGGGSPDADSFTFTDTLPNAVEFFVGNYAGGAPILFDDGPEPSNLSFVAGDVIYRDSGGSAIASPGTTGYNPAIRSFEIPFDVIPFAGWGGSGTQPSFTLEYRVRLISSP